MFKKYIYFVSFLSLVVFCFQIETVFAETHIPADTVIGQETWTIQGSPYILDGNVYIYSGQELDIEPGVEIVAGLGLEDPPGINLSGGMLNILGDEANRVKIHNIDGIFASSKSAVVIRCADFDISSSISLVNSWASVSSSTVANAFKAFDIKKSDVRITGSRIKNNKYGVFVSPITNPVLMMDDGNESSGIGGMGNAFNDLPPVGSFVQIENTSLVGNTRKSLVNTDTSQPVNAKNNWWGSKDGPLLTDTSSNSISGNIEYEPWLLRDPDEQNKKCCSSVLFIPGLEGTRLYTYESARNGRKNTNTLWEPINNNDVTKLYLDNTGSSTDRNIFSGEPIDKAYGIFGVYGKFMNFLNGLVNQGKISEWKAFGYDWRKSIDKVVAGEETKSTTTQSLVDTILSEAQKSKTGKVSIVAHSNGGLVTKYLVKKLTELGKSDIIDSVISVAVPYLGTPQAIPGLLYGDNQSIALGFITAKSVARGLGINMPSAYSLLPSKEYFSKILSPTIVFASSTIKGLNDTKYPVEIKDNNDQDAFIVDQYNSRRDAKFGDISSPIKGNSILMSASNAIHNILDMYNWPKAITSYSIVGWNSMTTSGIKYALNKKASKNKTIMGDGTVVAPSAAHDSGEVISADLSQISDKENTTFSHANILESSSTQKTIEDIITNTEPNKTLQNLPYGFSLGEPDYSKEPTFLVVSTHSPVELHVYDEQGRHTGPIEVPKNLGVEDGFLSMYEANIPGSSYDGGIGSEDSYIYLPEDSKHKYTVQIIGTGVGEFTYDVERKRNTETLNSIEYANIPVTQLTIASTTISSIGGDVTMSIDEKIFASSTNPLNVDIDGSGSVDMTVKPGEEIDNIRLLEQYKIILKNIGKESIKNKSLMKKIEDLQRKIRDNKGRKYENRIENISKRIKHKIYKYFNDKDKDELIDMIEETIKSITLKEPIATSDRLFVINKQSLTHIS